MNAQLESYNVILDPVDNHRLASLCGQCNEHIRQVENHLGVEIINRGHQFQIIGPKKSAKKARKLLNYLYAETAHQEILTPAKVHLFLNEIVQENEATTPDDEKDKSNEPKLDNQKHNETVVHTRNLLIKTRSVNQRHYINNIDRFDLNFGIGPAGTGKTYLAVACAVQALERDLVKRIILVRPAVEAGESLGFLPGDFSQKVNPYLRPLYDALYEMMGFEQVAKLIDHTIIEIAPLAYMRGRTLNDSFIILDEGQNTTKDQMKMFLTRIGFGSHTVVTGDITQVDLPHHQISGLRHAAAVLKGIDNIGFTFFQTKDVVRHPLVQTIVEAYHKNEKNDKNNTK